MLQIYALNYTPHFVFPNLNTSADNKEGINLDKKIYDEVKKNPKTEENIRT